MKLPNGKCVDLGAKLEEYVLNPLHPRGQHKARVFEAILGITLANKEMLASALRTAVVVSDNAVFAGENGFGRTYVVRFEIATAKGRAKVLSVWIDQTFLMVFLLGIQYPSGRD